MLRERRPYLTAGSFVDFETHGRKRLLPAFEHVPLARMDEERVRDWLALMVELVEAGDLAPKTVNNARTCLSTALNEACRRGLIPRNPCASVPPLPVDRRELDYLRADRRCLPGRGARGFRHQRLERVLHAARQHDHRAARVGRQAA